MGGFTRRALLGALPALPLVAAEFWDRKPYSDWSDEEVRRMLTGSPWAKSMTVPLAFEKTPDRWEGVDVPGTRPQAQGEPPGYGVGSPVGGIGAPMPTVPRDADITVLWSSARPIREAIALSKRGGGEALSDEDRREIERSESSYVVEAYGIPAITAHGGAQLIQREVYESAYLRTRTGRTLRAGSVYIPIQGDKLVISMRFPRDEALTLDDRWVECGAKTSMFDFSRRFILRQMMYGGKLEL